MKTPLPLLALAFALAALLPGRAVGQNDVYEAPSTVPKAAPTIKAYVNVPTLNLLDRPNAKPRERRVHPPAAVQLYVQPRSEQDARRYADPANAGWKWVEYNTGGKYVAGWARRRDLVLSRDSVKATFAGPEVEGWDNTLSGVLRQQRLQEAEKADAQRDRAAQAEHLIARLEAMRIPIDSSTGNVTYSGVGAVPGATTAELYTRARLWFAATFKSSKSVIEVDDKAAGIVAGKGNTVRVVETVEGPGVEMRVGYFVRIVARDGRYRYEISNLETALVESFRSASSYTGSAEDWLAGFRAKSASSNRPLVARTLNEVIGTATDLEASLKKGMAKPSSGKDDW